MANSFIKLDRRPRALKTRVLWVVADLWGRYKPERIRANRSDALTAFVEENSVPASKGYQWWKAQYRQGWRTRKLLVTETYLPGTQR